MSSGHIISDRRHFVGSGYGGTGLAGEYFESSWAGGDRAYPGDMTPHNYTKSVLQFYDGVVTLPNGHLANTSAGYGWGSDPSVYWDDNDTLKLSIKLGNKIRDTEFNAAIFLAEANESLALIGETAHRLAKFLGALKSGHLYRAASFLAGGDRLSRREKFYRTMRRHFKTRSAFDDRSALANAILEVQYGWRPMLQDAAGLGQSVAAILSRPPKTRFRVRRTIQAIKRDANGSAVWIKRKKISKQIIATVTSPPSWQDTIRLEDVGRAITNRTPWLFVANWFLPFEDYMEARSVFTDLNITQLILTTKQTVGGVFTGPYGANATTKEFVFTREVLANSPTGHMFANSFLNTPSFKPIEKSLGWEHVLNGIALLNTTVKRYRN